MSEKERQIPETTEHEKHVLNLIRQHRQISRTELSQNYNIPLSSLTRITDGLFQKDLIVESGTSNGDGKGRRQVILELNYERFKAVGISITRRSIRSVLMDLSAKIYAESEMSFLKDTVLQVTIRKLAQELLRICQENNVSVQDLSGIGIGSPGPLDRNSGTIIDLLWIKGWKSVQLGAKLKSYLDTNILLDFGANAAIMGEKWYGVGQEYHK